MHPSWRSSQAAPADDLLCSGHVVTERTASPGAVHDAPCGTVSTSLPPCWLGSRKWGPAAAATAALNHRQLAWGDGGRGRAWLNCRRRGSTAVAGAVRQGAVAGPQGDGRQQGSSSSGSRLGCRWAAAVGGPLVEGARVHLPERAQLRIVSWGLCRDRRLALLLGGCCCCCCSSSKRTGIEAALLVAVLVVTLQHRRRRRPGNLGLFVVAVAAV